MADTTTRDLAFDGTHIWVVNDGGANNPGLLQKLRASGGGAEGIVPVGVSPQGIAFDGTHVWVADSGSNSVSKRRR